MYNCRKLVENREKMSGRNLLLILPFREKCGILLVSVVILDKINRIQQDSVEFLEQAPTV